MSTEVSITAIDQVRWAAEDKSSLAVEVTDTSGAKISLLLDRDVAKSLRERLLRLFSPLPWEGFPLDL